MQAILLFLLISQADATMAHRVVLSAGSEYGTSGPTTRNYTMSPGSICWGEGDRDCLICYSRAHAHVAYDSQIVCQRSYDGGATFEGEELIIIRTSSTTTAVHDDPVRREVGVSLSKVDGRIYLTHNAVKPDSDTTKPLREIRWLHTDYPVTGVFEWSPYTLELVNTTGTGGSIPLYVSQGGSRILVWGNKCRTGFYDRKNGDQCYRVKLASAPLTAVAGVGDVCTDGAWTHQVVMANCTLNNGHYGQAFEEPTLCVDPFDVLGPSERYMTARDDIGPDPYGIDGLEKMVYLSKSTDDGETWQATPTLLWPGGARPECIIDRNGCILIGSRDPTNADKGFVRQSCDHAATWTDPLYFTDPANGKQIYSSMIERAPGIVQIVYSIELTASPNLKTRMEVDIFSTSLFH